MKGDNVYKIRPSARILSTIGKDLISDQFAAVVELVKNSYDADATQVNIVVDYKENQKLLVFQVSDNGHGMDVDVVENRWLVPATSDKLSRKESPGGRVLQGRKGIGRFAAAALGSQIYLTTQKKGADGVSLLLDLDNFSIDKYLDEIEIHLDVTPEVGDTGTSIIIESTSVEENDLKANWNQKSFSALQIELSKLMAPQEVIRASKSLGYMSKNADVFNINLTVSGFGDCDIDKNIEPFNLIDLYDYRVMGSVSDDGSAKLYFHNSNLTNEMEELGKTKEIKLPGELNNRFPGAINFDIRAFDRDAQSIDQLINRGLVNPSTGKTVGKREARNILDQYYGISIFRGSFRLRPYGDPEFDWLELDKKRTQNTKKIGHNQVIGFISIQPEEYSRLEEKSARDGLVRNNYYEALREIMWFVLSILEVKRVEYREGKNRAKGKEGIEEQIDALIDNQGIKRSIQKSLSELNISPERQSEIIIRIESDIEVDQARKRQKLDAIKEKIVYYQGQATLGKIASVLIHDGRKHLKVINEVPPRISKWAKKLASNYDEDLYVKLENRSQLLQESAKNISRLYKMIEPLSSTRNPKRGPVVLRESIEKCFTVFESDIESKEIKINNEIPNDLVVYGSEFDLSTIFLNLIENSIYWLSTEKPEGRVIYIKLSDSYEDKLEVSFSDSGPGFADVDLETIFEPGVSLRGGTGLGLALAGEAVIRISGQIKAIDSDGGAHFIVTFTEADK